MLNRTIIQGRLTKDVEVRATPSGTKVASVTIAWSEKYKETERTLFMPCVIWGAQAEFAASYFSKGQEVIVEGYLTSRKWQDKYGSNRETIELTAERLHFCGKKETTPSATKDTPLPSTFDVPSDFASTVGVNDDELPF